MSNVPIQGDAPDLFAKRFQVTIESPKAVPLGQLIGNAEELLKLKFTKLAGALDNRILHVNAVLTTEIQRTAGTGSVVVFYESSPDGITWTPVLGNSEIGAGFLADANQINGILLADTVFFLRLALYNTLANTAGNVQHVKFFVDLVAPQSYILERLI